MRIAHYYIDIIVNIIYTFRMTESERTRISALITAIGDGDVNALDELSVRVSARMLSVARSIVRDGALAEDVVQDSFIKIIGNAGKFKRGTNGYAWICKIVQNTALNAIRRERGRTVNIDELYDIEGGGDIAESAIASAAVKTAMHGLTAFEKTLIYQKYFMDLTVRESAKLTGKSKSTVARTIAAAEQKMRGALAPRDKNDG